MKKNYFFGAVALCGLLAFTSCGNDDDPILDGPGNEVATGEQVIVLDMQDTDVLSTKSRPLYSTDNRGSEDVTDVMLYIFKEETGTQKLIKTIHVDNWDNTCEEYKYGRKRTIKLEGKDKLQAGSTYTIYAVGQRQRWKAIRLRSSSKVRKLLRMMITGKISRGFTLLRMTLREASPTTSPPLRVPASLTC